MGIQGRHRYLDRTDEWQRRAMGPWSEIGAIKSSPSSVLNPDPTGYRLMRGAYSFHVPSLQKYYK